MDYAKTTRDISLPPVQEDEFWTAKQRAGHAIHEVSYRACYKPQLPAYFLHKFCRTPAVIYDPFMGRGTTLIEAQLHGHRALGNDINPLSIILTKPRLNPPSLAAIEKRLHRIPLNNNACLDPELLVFFQRDTLREIYGWRQHFTQQQPLDHVDAWLQMVACGRLTGHSSGFFSVYTLPPNQATSVTAQRKINTKRQQVPPYRDTKELIWRKSRQLLRHPLPRHYYRQDALLLTASAEHTPQIPDNTIDLVVTSPPFLDTVDYRQDNWLRMWFCNLEVAAGKLWQLRSVPEWVAQMTEVFIELRRLLKKSGRIAFEVGEVRNGSLQLEQEVVVAAQQAGLVAENILINTQHFTKTANCWGVDNNRRGTNSNRIVVLRK